jgi:hypothetical protein
MQKTWTVEMKKEHLQKFVDELYIAYSIRNKDNDNVTYSFSESAKRLGFTWRDSVKSIKYILIQQHLIEPVGRITFVFTERFFRYYYTDGDKSFRPRLLENLYKWTETYKKGDKKNGTYTPFKRVTVQKIKKSIDKKIKKMVVDNEPVATATTPAVQYKQAVKMEHLDILKQSITNAMQSGLTIPMEWFTEYNSIVKK